MTAAAYNANSLIAPVLPEELLVDILNFCTAEDLARVFQVSKSVFTFCRQMLPHLLRERASRGYDDCIKFRWLLQSSLRGQVSMHQIANLMAPQLRCLNLAEPSNSFWTGRIPHWTDRRCIGVPDGLGHSSNAMLHRISQVFSTEYPKLKTLHLPSGTIFFPLRGEETEDFQIRGIEALVFHQCPALTSLTMHCMKVDAAFFRFMGENLTRLQQLNLKLSRGITNEALEFALGRLAHLRHLDLSHCRGLDINSMEIVVQHASQLTLLSVIGSTNSRGVEILAAGCKQLTCFDISCISINDETLHVIANNLSKLCILQMQGGWEYTDAGLEKLGQGCHDLALLELTNSRFTVRGIKMLLKGCNIHQIVMDQPRRPSITSSSDLSYIDKLRAQGLITHSWHESKVKKFIDNLWHSS